MSNAIDSGLSANDGLTLVGKNTRLPAGFHVACECVDCDLTENDFTIALAADDHEIDHLRREPACYSLANAQTLAV